MQQRNEKNCWLLWLIMALIHVEEFASVDLDVPTALSTHNTALDDWTALCICILLYIPQSDANNHTQERRGLFKSIPYLGNRDLKAALPLARKAQEIEGYTTNLYPPANHHWCQEIALVSPRVLPVDSWIQRPYPPTWFSACGTDTLENLPWLPSPGKSIFSSCTGWQETEMESLFFFHFFF